MLIVLRPDPKSRLQVRVFIYPSLVEMRRAVVRTDRIMRTVNANTRRSGPTRRLQGICYGLVERGHVSRRVRPTFAMILLSRTCLGIGTLSHEVWHATCRYLDRRKIRPYRTDFERPQEDQDLEERAARAHDEMMQQLVRGLYRKKVLT